MDTKWQDTSLMYTSQSKIKGVICIGAHYGEEYELWKSLGAQNFLFFEPVKENFEKLQNILEGKAGVKLIRKAIGNQRGRIEMYCESSHNGKSCSILKPKKHLEQYPDIIFDRTELVEIERLDNIIYNRQDYDHLHIDTQGYEIEVLKGAEKSLRFINSIQLEVYREELFEGCPMIADIVDYLVDFKLKGIVWRGYTWGDAYFER